MNGQQLDNYIMGVPEIDQEMGNQTMEVSQDADGSITLAKYKE